MKIKNYFQLSMIVLLVLMIFGCMGEDGSDGRDGEDGDAYVSFYFITPFTYVTDDPGIPSIIFSGSWYQTTPGTYAMAYESWDNSIWALNYTVTINEGEPGEKGEKGAIFLKDGEDGEDGEDGTDMCFFIGCWSDGPTLNNQVCNPTSAKTIGVNNSLENENDDEIAYYNETLFDLDFILSKNDTNVTYQKISSNRYTVELLSKQIK